MSPAVVNVHFGANRATLFRLMTRSVAAWCVLWLFCPALTQSGCPGTPLNRLLVCRTPLFCLDDLTPDRGAPGYEVP